MMRTLLLTLLFGFVGINVYSQNERTFVLDSNSMIEGISGGAIVFNKTDTGGTLVISGSSNSGMITYIYEISKDSIFTKRQELTGTMHSSMAFLAPSQNLIISGLNNKNNSVDYSTISYEKINDSIYIENKKQRYADMFGIISVGDFFDYPSNIEPSEDVSILGEVLFDDKKTYEAARIYLSNGSKKFYDFKTVIPMHQGYSKAVDLNKDGFDELVITGNAITRRSGKIPDSVKIYTRYNSDALFFKKLNATGIRNIFNGSIAHADVNRDSLQDLLIMGSPTMKPLNCNTTLYINKGNFNFEESNQVFTQMIYGSIEFSDIDNDGDDDIFITGMNFNKNNFAELYLNDGKGNFKKQMNLKFPGVSFSSMIFIDYNRDGFKDILYSGKTNDGTRKAYLYKNMPSEKLIVKNIKISSKPTIPDDNFFVKQELTVTYDLGNCNTTNNSTYQWFKAETLSGLNKKNIEGATNKNYYLNINDTNSFVGVTIFPKCGIRQGDIEISKYCGPIIYKPNKPTVSNVIIMGQPLKGYTVKGIYTYKEQDSLKEYESKYQWYRILESNSTKTHIKGAESRHYKITAEDIGSNLVFAVIPNDGIDKGLEVQSSPLGPIKPTPRFYKEKESSINGCNNCTLATADVDNDGDTDVFLSGYTEVGSLTLKSGLYLNDGSGNFTITKNQFGKFYGGTANFVNFIGDSDLDLITGGQNVTSGGSVSGIPSTNFYRNNGNGKFSEITTPFKGNVPQIGSSGSITSSISKKSYQQIYLSNSDTSIIYWDPSNGQHITWNRACDIKFPKIGQNLSINNAFSDINNDGFMDLLTVSPKPILYLNRSGCRYDVDSNFISPPNKYLLGNSVNFADVNNDGYNDMFLTGFDSQHSYNYFSYLYLNDKYGKFIQYNKTFPGVVNASISFEDIDNDKDLDLLLAGYYAPPYSDGVGNGIIRVYLNDGKGNYSRQNRIGLPDSLTNKFQKFEKNPSIFINLNNDNYPDAILTGFDSITRLYLNSTIGPPSISEVSISGNLNIGDTLLGVFKKEPYFDGAKFEVSFSWYRSSTQKGWKTLIPQASSNNYIITEADLNSYITFEVTPLNSRGHGMPIMSDSHGLVSHKNNNLDENPRATTKPKQH